MTGLTEDQIAFQDAARSFAQAEMEPHAAQWDEEKIFPEDTLRQAAELGFAGIYVDPAHGGSGLTRVDAAVIFEELAAGCTSTAAYVSAMVLFPLLGPIPGRGLPAAAAIRSRIHRVSRPR